MLGWHAGYVKKTGDMVSAIQIDARTKALVPEGSDISYMLFLPFIGDEEPGDPVKSRYKRKVFYFKVEGEGFYIKKYSFRFTKKHYAVLRGFIWSIPTAARQMHKMLFLRERGAPVAEPVLGVVRRYGLLKQESMLVMRECRGMLLKQFLHEVDDFDRRLNIIAQSLSFLYKLHSNRIHHGDMARHNFIVTAEDRLMAIDLDERKTKWLGELGNRRELRKWLKKCARILNGGHEGHGAERRSAFEEALEKNYPGALAVFRSTEKARPVGFGKN